ncbi:glutathione-independent formaldehyde dehydrogenase [Hymenobacter siberiensis]|uniref:glutathione-independent formaldehyde dehydrogenase n=1 Tax=Hymenobacter siberiensis TaxID=2848396 RepID=UPI001C1DE846|nr:glutathione-independent formaldehyde dehydrogenase [Hymenobacter siberiensis]MBU6121478.1 glutathione-independent formaldehyde dehydrogenase [Hymenobacter siberiensis]
MKAIVYYGPLDVRVSDKPDPKIEQPTDVLVQVTTTNICGSDLHMYEGRTNMETGRIFGHENLGRVIEVGKSVVHVKVGDMVCMPFNIGCGHCKNCERKLTAFCLTMNPGFAGAAYGFAGMGPYEGGQAEYLRVPYGDFNCQILPEDASEKENDYAMLSDIFPTGYHATELAGVKPGDSVVIYGAGPVGLMATLSARIKGADKIMVVDSHPDRLKLAKEFGGIPIDFTKGSAVDQVLDLTDGQGADRGCECVGYQCCNKHGKEQSNVTMNELVQAVKATGSIGVVGVFVTEDPKSKEELQKKGHMDFDFGSFWMKGQSIATGQANVKSYNRELCALISSGKAKPAAIVSHELSLDEAPDAYKHFNTRDDGWTKVVLKPGKTSRKKD